MVGNSGGGVVDCNHVRFYEGFNDEAQVMRRRGRK
jgi:hypothetical protein